LVQVDVNDGSSNTAPVLSLSLRGPGRALQPLISGDTHVYNRSAPGINRLSAQFDARSLATGAYSFVAVVGRHWADRTETSEVPVRVLILNESDSYFGSGWSLPGLQRVHRVSDGVVLTGGDGSIAFFEGPDASSTADVERFTSPAGDYTRLSYVRSGGYFQREYRDGSVALFSTGGWITQLRNRFGSATRFQYDGSGRMLLQAVADPVGQTTRFSYAAGSVLGAITDPGGRVTRVQFTGGGTSTSTLEVTAPDGQVTLRATFDPQRRLTNWCEPSRVSHGCWYLAYDVAGKLATLYNPPAVAEGGNTFQTVMQFTSPELLQLSGGTASNPASNVNPANVWARVTGTDGGVARALVDRWGAASRVVMPNGDEASMTLNDEGLVTGTLDALGNSVTYVWDRGRLMQISGTRVPQTFFEYMGPDSEQLTRSHGDGPEARYHYSGGSAWTMDSTWVAGSGTARFTYDSRGRLLSTVDPHGHATSYTYEQAYWGNLETITTSGAKVTRFGGWDGFGRPTEVTRPDGGTARSTYDLLNRTTLSRAASGATTTYEWRATRLSAVTDPLGQRFSFAIDGLDWVRHETRPAPNAASRNILYDYDRFGRVNQRINRRGQQTLRFYDQFGRDSALVASDWRSEHHRSPASTSTTARRWEAIITPDAIDTLHYDLAGRLRDQVQLRRYAGAWRRFVVTTEYDPMGRLAVTTLTLPDGTRHWTRYEYDQTTGQMFRMVLSHPTELATQFGYDSEGKVSTVSFPGGQVLQYGYTSAHQLSSISYPDNPGLQSAAGVAYEYDRSNRVTGLRNERGLQSYTYDADGQLVRHDFHDVVPGVAEPCKPSLDFGAVCNEAEPNFRYSGSVVFPWDAAGNPRVEGWAVVDPGNRLAKYGNLQMEYDADGNMTRKFDASNGQDYRYEYNSQDRLVTVRRNWVQVAAYRYDGQGRRVERTAGGVTTHYVYSGDELIAEVDGNGALKAEYTYSGLDRPHTLRRGGDVYYYATDQQGSVLALFKGNGEVVARYAYGAFGETTYANASVDQPLRYTARELDVETGQYFYRARWYDPGLRRFTSEDPIGISGGLNLFAYVGNDPVNLRDPSGLSPDIVCILAKSPTQTVTFDMPGEDEVTGAYKDAYQWVCIPVDTAELQEFGNARGWKPWQWAAIRWGMDRFQHQRVLDEMHQNNKIRETRALNSAGTCVATATVNSVIPLVGWIATPEVKSARSVIGWAGKSTPFGPQQSPFAKPGSTNTYSSWLKAERSLDGTGVRPSIGNPAIAAVEASLPCLIGGIATEMVRPVN
jgi:RHS repeat-associated protein